MLMGPFDYVVKKIDGDYAVLERMDVVDDQGKLVARALLPGDIVEGSKLHYESLMYEIIK